jgi:hypothetical protein
MENPDPEAELIPGNATDYSGETKTVLFAPRCEFSRPEQAARKVANV